MYELNPRGSHERQPILAFAAAPAPGGQAAPRPPVAAGAPPQAALQAERGPLAGQRFPLRSPFTIGRSAECRRCGVVLPDTLVSRQHARLELREGRWTIQDLNSANGTTLNRQRLAGSQPLSSGDLIGIGESVFLFTAQAAAARPAAPPAPSARPAGRSRRRGAVAGIVVGVVLIALLVAAAVLISRQISQEDEVAPGPALPTIQLPTIKIPTITLPTALPSIEIPTLAPLPTALPDLEPIQTALPNLEIPTGLPKLP